MPQSFQNLLILLFVVMYDVDGRIEESGRCSFEFLMRMP